MSEQRSKVHLRDYFEETKSENSSEVVHWRDFGVDIFQFRATSNAPTLDHLALSGRVSRELNDVEQALNLSRRRCRKTLK